MGVLLRGKDGEHYVEHMWEQVKLAMVESAREVCGSVRVGRVCGGGFQRELDHN